MKTELLSKLSVASVRSLLLVPRSAVLRVFLAIAIATNNGLAMVSATELAAITGLTERSVFSALGYLEDNGFIARESQGPGPFANRIRIVDPQPAKVGPTIEECGGRRSEAPHLHQDEPENILDRIAECYRPLNEQEQQETGLFFKHNFTNSKHILEILDSIKLDRGVASSEPLNFFFCVVRTYDARLHATGSRR